MSDLNGTVSSFTAK